MARHIKEKQIIFAGSLADASVVISKDADGDTNITIDLGDGDNVPPVIVNTNFPPGEVGEAYSINLNDYAQDADGDDLTFTIDQFPAGLSLNGTTGALTGTPTTAGPVTGTLTVTDSNQATAQTTIIITINEAVVNQAPEFNTNVLPDGRVGSSYNVNLLNYVSDPNGDSITCSVSSGLPSGVSLNNNVLSGIPDTVESATFTITAQDPDGAQTNKQFTVEIIAAGSNSAPVWSSTTLPGANGGESYSVDLDNYVYDPDGDEITITVTSGLPAGLSFDENSHIISGTMANANSTFNIDVVADDGTTTTNATLTLQVTTIGANTPPSFTANTIPSGILNQQYSYDLSNIVTDSDGDDLVITSVGTLPPGIDPPLNNVLAGIPTQAGTFTLDIRASDGSATSSGSITFIISEANTAPVFTVTALPDATELEYYEVDLDTVVNDADGDTLTVTVDSGLPTGLSYDSNSHILSGTPSVTGSYGVVCTVSDGRGGSANRALSLDIGAASASASTYRHLPVSGTDLAQSNGLITNGTFQTGSWTIQNSASFADSDQTAQLPNIGSRIYNNGYLPVTPNSWYLLRFNLESDQVPHATCGVQIATEQIAGGAVNQFIHDSIVTVANEAQEILIPFFVQSTMDGVRFYISQADEIDGGGQSALKVSSLAVFKCANSREMGGLVAPSARRPFSGSKVSVSANGRLYRGSTEHQIRGIYMIGTRTNFSDYVNAGFNTAFQVKNAGDAGKCRDAGLYFFWDLTPYCDDLQSDYNDNQSTVESELAVHAAADYWQYCIGWYVDYEDNIQEEYARINTVITAAKNTDDGIPFAMVAASPYVAQRFNDTIDMLMCYHNSTLNPSDSVEGLIGWGYSFPHMSNLKIPVNTAIYNTPHEGNQLRDNVFNAFAHGYKGYTYWRDGGSQVDIENHNWFSTIAAVNAEFEAVKDFIGGSHQSDFLTSTTPDELYGSVKYGAFVDGANKYLCVANDEESAAGSQQVTIDFTVNNVTDAYTGDVVMSPGASSFTIGNSVEFGRLLKLNASGAVSNTAPSWSSATLPRGDTQALYSVDLNDYVSDSDGDNITVTLTSSLPAGLNYDDATKVISGTPSATGNFSINATASDGNLSTDAVLSLEVIDSSAPYTGDGTEIPDRFIRHELGLLYQQGSGTPEFIQADSESGFSGASYLKASGSNFTGSMVGKRIRIPLDDLTAGVPYRLWLHANTIANDWNSFLISIGGGEVNANYFHEDGWNHQQRPWQVDIYAADGYIEIGIRENNCGIDLAFLVPAGVTLTPTGKDGFYGPNMVVGSPDGGQSVNPDPDPDPPTGESLMDIPGHYMFVSGSGNQASQQSSKLNGLNNLISEHPWNDTTKTGWRGCLVERRLDWTMAGGTEADNETDMFEAATAAGMYVQSYIKDINFGLSSDPNSGNYATPAKSFAPSSWENAGEAMVGGNPSNIMACAKLHQESVMSKFITAVKAFHDKHKHHASYRGITVPETSRAEFTGTDLNNKDHYTNISAAWSVQYKRMVTELAPYMAPYILNVQINYFDEYLEEVINHCMQYANVEFGTPDMVLRLDADNPDREGSKIIEVYRYMRARKNINWIGGHGETREVSTDTSDPVDDMNELWKLNHGPYDHKLDSHSIFHFNWHPRPSVANDWKNIVTNKVVAENWYTNRTSPEFGGDPEDSD